MATDPRGLQHNQLHARLMDVDDLPTIPEIAVQVLGMLNGEATSIRALATLIARDQVLTARLLPLANTAFFALRRSLTNVPEIVTLLGFARVRDIVLSLSVWDGFVPLDAHRRQALWTHSILVAAAAQSLAPRVGVDPAEVYTSGLLHDVGKLVLGLRVGTSYWQLLHDTNAGNDLIAAEERAYGCHHGTVGAWLLEVWRLPPTLVGPVAAHHAPLPRAGRPHAKLDTAQLVAIADRLVTTTNDQGIVSSDALTAILAVVPGLITQESWRETYRALDTARAAMSTLFERS
jgi:putative nucleotidyltransferase with HDIG domain